MTAVYSNAVLVALLPPSNDFAKKLELREPSPMTTNHVKSSSQWPIKDQVEGAFYLTNGDWFDVDSSGYVRGYRTQSDIYYYVDPTHESELKKLAGTPTITTNQAITFARDTIKKLGYKPEYFGAQNAPTSFEEPFKLRSGETIPFCKISWDVTNDPPTQFSIAVDTARKEIVEITVMFSKNFEKTNTVGSPLKVDVVPELESDFRKRMQKPMFTRTNAPPVLHRSN